MAYTITQTSVTVGATSTSILPENIPGRVYAAICNLGDVPVFLSINGTPAVLNSGIAIPAGGSVTFIEEGEINRPWMEGAINGIVSVAPVIVAVTEVSR